METIPIAIKNNTNNKNRYHTKYDNELSMFDPNKASPPNPWMNKLEARYKKYQSKSFSNNINMTNLTK